MSEEQKILASMIKRYEEMTPEQIAKDTLVLIDKAIGVGIDAGYELSKQKTAEAIEKWKRDEIIKAMMEGK